jgi:hypothetical protein
MNEKVTVSKHLEIELMPSTDKSDPALRLYAPNDPSQSFVVFLSEVYVLRDALAAAGARLAEIEKASRRQRKG